MPPDGATVNVPQQATVTFNDCHAEVVTIIVPERMMEHRKPVHVPLPLSLHPGTPTPTSDVTTVPGSRYVDEALHSRSSKLYCVDRSLVW